MLDLLVKSSVRRKIVGLFALNPGEEFYAGQVAREIDESPHAVGLELRYLVDGGLLRSFSKGRQTFYQLNPSYPFAEEVKSVFNRLRENGNEEVCQLPDLAWGRELNKNLERVLNDIKKYYDPEKIILFGSAASGHVGPYSDLDLVIIKKTDLTFFKRVQQLVDLLEYDVGIDFLVYTPEEFERAVKERRFFQEEIIGKGKVLYDKEAA